MRKSKSLSIFLTICLVFFIITFSIALPIYCRFFYYMQINALELTEAYIPSIKGPISYDQIKTAYDELMHYLTIGGDFKTGILLFSQSGKEHFDDVKYLFNFNIFILIISFASIVAIHIATRKGTHYKLYKFKNYSPYFHAGIITLSLFALLGILVSINFENAFTIFHKILFPGKDNWTFNYYEDEIINILPMQFFMNCAILIVSSIILISFGFIIYSIIAKKKKEKSPIKIVAIDIDGTLLTKDKKLTNQTIEIIKEASSKGVYIVIASGRPYQGIVPILQQLGLVNENNYTISFGGALVVNNLEGRPICDYSLNKSNALELTDLAAKMGLTSHVFADQNCYLEKENKYSTIESTLNHIPLIYQSYDNLKDDAVVNKVMWVDDPEKLKVAHSQLNADLFKKYSIVFSAPFFLEFLNPKAQKGLALKELTELLDLDYYNVMAIGDEENDKSMLKYAKIKVAMENANVNLKKVANYITSSNNEDGVAKAIHKFVLESEEPNGNN